MSVIVGLIDQAAVGLYVLVAVAFVWYLLKWLQARESGRATTFELERDFSSYKSANAATVLVLLIELGLVVAGVQRVVAPQMREDRLVRNNQAQQVALNINADGEFNTPTPAPAQGGAIPDPVDPSVLGGAQVADIASTPTNTPTPVGTIEPNVPAVQGCDTPKAFLQIPANGMRVFQQTPVVGTAFLDDGTFSLYKLEIRGVDIAEFSPIDTVTIPQQELGALTQFNPASLTRGTYQFRLMVFDQTDTLRASCQVTISVTDPPLTATPIPTSQPGAPPAFSTAQPEEIEEATVTDPLGG